MSIDDPEETSELNNDVQPTPEIKEDNSQQRITFT